MTNKTDSDGNLLPDELRKTSFGSWLRNTSLDELPELLNILNGDMAIIGPRPMPSKYNIYFSDYEKKRFKVRGGLLPPEVLRIILLQLGMNNYSGKRSMVKIAPSLLI